MNIPVISMVGDVFKGVIDVVGQYVEDKDKKNEIILKISELQNQLAIAMLQQQTVTWVDATVKMMFAVRDVAIPLMRPIVGAVMTAFAAYMAWKQIPMNPMMEAIMASAFPGWMASRHFSKK